MSDILDTISNPVKSFADIFDPKAREESKVFADTGLQVPQVQELMDLLQALLRGDAPNSTQQPLLAAGVGALGVSPEDRVQQNKEIASSLANPILDANQASLSRSLAGRGIANSGLAVNTIGDSRNQVLSDVLNQTLQRSFEESLASKELGGELLGGVGKQQLGFAELLTSLIQSLTGAGIGGQASQFAASEGVRGGIFQTGLKGAIGGTESGGTE